MRVGKPSKRQRLIPFLRRKKTSHKSCLAGLPADWLRDALPRACASPVIPGDHQLSAVCSSVSWVSLAWKPRKAVRRILRRQRICRSRQMDASCVPSVVHSCDSNRSLRLRFSFFNLAKKCYSCQIQNHPMGVALVLYTWGRRRRWWWRRGGRRRRRWWWWRRKRRIEACLLSRLLHHFWCFCLYWAFCWICFCFSEYSIDAFINNILLLPKVPNNKHYHQER